MEITFMSRRCTTVTCCLAITAVALITPSFSSQSPRPSNVASDANSAQKVDPIVEAGRRELKLPGVSDRAVMLGHKLVLAERLWGSGS